MNWKLFVASRYFKIRRKERFVSIISLISILGVAVGVAALIIVLAVMSGFDRELKTRIIGTTPHILIERDGGIVYPDPFVEKVLSETDDVIDSFPLVEGEAILKHGDKFTGAIVRGLEDKTGLVVGSELARSLKLKIGDKVSLISAIAEKPQDFEITGVFNSGLYEFDARNIFISLESAQRLFGTDKFVSFIAVKIGDELKADKVKKDIIKKLGFPYFVRSWIDLNKNFFGALKLEKITMFAIVTLIVIVACFNIASTLIVRVVEKTKDIGILKAIGATNRDIRSIFRLEGLFVGLIGTVLGVGSGLCISWLQKTYKIVRLPAEIYYIDALPVYINWQDSLIIAVSAVFLSLMATIYPSHKAARLEIAEALRYG